MQRYHVGSCTSAVNNSGISGIQSRDASRADPSTVSANFSQNSRRSAQPAPYKLRCDKEPLNSRLGPPDFHPQTPNCPEETLTREYVQSGYRETVEGLEESREIILSQVQFFNNSTVVKCKEAIRKCHRAINESRAQKRKAGQVYGVPLSGTLLTKAGIFPDQRPCGEDFKRKWIEGLSQPHKRLRSLADHVPHGYRRKSLFEVLIRNNVPLLRATWFIKVTYLNQVRVNSSNSSSGYHDKTQVPRSEQWTKDIIEYLQYLLDEFITKNNTHSAFYARDRPSQMIFAGSLQQKGDPFSSIVDGEEPSLYTKWWYVVRIIHWHHAEGLVTPSLIIDWVLNQLQEKELLSVLQLLLPIIYGVIETVVSSQSYVRTLMGIAVRFIQEPSPGGSDLVNNSRRAYTTSAVVEMLRYLVLAVPDTFVALDCFPLPTCVTSHVVNDGSFLSKMVEDVKKVKFSQIEVSGVHRDRNHDVQADSFSLQSVVSSIQKRSETLSRAAKPNYPGHNVAKALKVLDQALMHGDVEVSYRFLFENTWDEVYAERWSDEVCPCLLTSLKHISMVKSSLLCCIFLICEWATCEFRDFHSAPPHGLKFTGRRDFSHIFIAIRLLKLKMSTLYCSNKKNRDISDIFESPSPLHDVIVCWVDQHEVHNREGFTRLQLLIRELMRSGIFNPLAYSRQLIVSGIVDGTGPMVNLERQKRHYKLLKQLPAPYIRDALEEAQLAEPPVLSEAINVYSNERRLLLDGLLGLNKSTPGTKNRARKKKYHQMSENGNGSPASVDQWYFQATSKLSSDVDTDIKLDELKTLISSLLQFPNPTSSADSGVDESHVGIKRPGGVYNRSDSGFEERSECEECRRVKRQKLSEEMSSLLQSSPVDDEEIWWIKKGVQYMESYRAEPPPKPAKQTSRSRQKSVRKTQSLAQLAAARIEGSQGASTSHVCESRIECPHHRSVSDDITKSVDVVRKNHSGDIVSIGKLLKQMRFVEKRKLAVWLVSFVKHLIEEAERTTPKVGQYGRSFSANDGRSSVLWRLGENELSAILYMMDACYEYISATRFLLWLLPKIPNNPASAIPSRSTMMLPRLADNSVYNFGESFLLSSIRSYESIIVAADLIPETLSVTMHRAATFLASKGRLSAPPALVYARHILKKYNNVASVVEWEKAFKLTCDKRQSSEIDSARSSDGDFGFTLGVPNGVEDHDDYFRQKINGAARISRVGLSMKEIVNKHVDEVFQYFYSKDRKPYGTGANKVPSMEKWEDGHPLAHQIVVGLIDCMKQTGGAAQEGDPSLVSSAIAAIVNNVGHVISRIPDLSASSNHLNVPPPSGSLHFARRILRVHITCLCLLKEALGERQSRVFEVALATEASSALMQALAPGKAPRNQFQTSPESLDFNANLPNETLNNSNKAALGRAARITAVSALVIGAILQGVASLDRMVTLFRIKEGLDLMQFARSLKTNVNGNARPTGASKIDNLIEVSLIWFSVLVGNCRTVCDGLIVELLGEASIVTLSRMQRLLSLNLIFPPAYSIFAFVIWKPILDASVGVREDSHQLSQSLAVSIGDTIKHFPFREICFRNSHGLYDLMAEDTLDSEFVSMLQSNGTDSNLKAAALVPLRSRLFLDALIDCKMPESVIKLNGGNWIFGQGELKKQCAENVKKLTGRLVHVLDNLQPAKFHWQWMELRLLLNEQAVNEKIMENEISFTDAIRSLSPHPDKSTASENESNFVQIILTRLLVRPDAAPLFSEAVHLLGKSLEDSMLSQAKWLLRGAEVLYGKKSIRQKVMNIAADIKELSIKPHHWKPWGWVHMDPNQVSVKGERLKSGAGVLEEGEVIDEGADFNNFGKGHGLLIGEGGSVVSQQHLTERALIELILPCVDQGSHDLRNSFASEMIKQMSNIEQHINTVTRGGGKSAATPSPAIGSPANKTGSRKSGKNSSPGIPRQSTGSVDTVPPSPAALRASMALRLQFLLRLLPIICGDREPSGRNMRYALASIILRLLGSRVVHEDYCHYVKTARNSSNRDPESLMETSTFAAFLCGESLFDCLLLVLHVLLSSYQPSWLKMKSDSKSTECSKDYAVFDREVAESLQNDLDRMELPETIRWRIQSALPIVTPPIRSSISCQPPSVSPTVLAWLQPSNPVSLSNASTSNLPHRNSVLPRRATTNMKTKSQTLQQDLDMEVDQWTLLEDGAGSGQPSPNSSAIGSSDHVNFKASYLFKGAVRVRRTDLTYIGAVDEDS